MKNYALFLLILFLFSACDSEDYDELDLKSKAICNDGIAINNSGISYKCKNYDLMGLVSLETMDATRANDIWGWTDTLTGKEFALIGLDNGTGFVSIKYTVNLLAQVSMHIQECSVCPEDPVHFVNHDISLMHLCSVMEPDGY